LNAFDLIAGVFYSRILSLNVWPFNTPSPLLPAAFVPAETPAFAGHG